MRSVGFWFYPFQYNSQCVDFPEWVTLWTLCLTPLLAHIIAGAPSETHLTRNLPKWHDSLCHYNPTSILWRYAAITDRRIRATRWSHNDIAASNAIFWTAKGWNGSEDMVIEAVPHCVRCPESTHVQIISVSFLKTIIIALQGVASLYTLITPLAGPTILNVMLSGLGMDTVFSPLAVLGLLRLCAAAWLTEDFEYSLWTGNQNQAVTRSIISLASNDHDIHSVDYSENLDPFLITPFQPDANFTSPKSSWKSCLFRIFFLAIIGGIWALSLVLFIPDVYSHFNQRTVTSFLASVFYFLFLSVSLLLYTFYFICAQTTTTILPCISKPWYKLYTVLVMSFIFVLVTVASIETSRHPAGFYSSIPILEGLECRYRTDWMDSHLNYFNSSFLYALLSDLPKLQIELGESITGSPMRGLSRDNSSLEHSLWLYNLTGYCVGHFKEMGTL